MQVIVKHPRIIGGKLFAKSEQPQNIPDAHADHWFTKALIKVGDIVPVVKAEAKQVEKEAAPQSQKKGK